MPGLTSSMFIGLSGLQAQQSALNVVGNNIANVNTPGYTREVSNLMSNPSQVQGQNYFGSGVSLDTVTSVRDKFLDLQLGQATSAQAKYNTLSAGVSVVSSALGDTTSSGLAAQIQSFFQGFQTLAANPGNGAALTSVVGNAQSMISSLQTNYSLLQQQQAAANQTLGTLVTQVNTLTSQIAQLNQQITGSDTTGVNNAAVDQRTTLTNQLAQLVGINVIDGGNSGQYQITLDSGAATLVSGTSSFNLTAGGAPGGSTVSSAMAGLPNGGDVTSSITSGQLGAELTLGNTTYPGYESQLDAIATAITGQVNTLNFNGYAAGAAATTGTNFFQGSLAGGDLSVTAAIVANPSLNIATATTPNAPGDNTNANAIANLQSATGLVPGVTGTFSDAVGSLVGTVGTDSQNYQTQSTTQQNLVSALQTQRDQVSGVSLDEEATNMMQLQTGYQASAHFLNVIDSLTAGLITQFGGTAP
jgi:flagellar hook-associated protein 1